MREKKHKPKIKHSHSTSKIPHQGTTTNPESILNKNPSWRFRLMDMDGEWNFKNIKKDCLLTIHKKLCQYEKKAWKEIDNRKNDHLTPVSNIVKRAKKRLSELNLDEYDRLYRFRLSGKRRLWGIRDHEYFYILWWDPEHTVYPSVKKHT